MSSYEDIVTLARRELELVEQGRWEELPALAAERQAVVDGLPAVAPAEARAHLVEAERLVNRTIQLSALALADARARLAQLRTRRRALAEGSAPSLNSRA